MTPRLSRGVAYRYYLDHVQDETDECLSWPFIVTEGGYGRFWLEGRWRAVHVLACEHRYGPRPHSEMIATHLPVICHNRSCFNYRHLRWATRSQNSADQVLDGTHIAGERNGRAKLTLEQVSEVRHRFDVENITQTDLASEYGVNRSTIGRIISGKYWKITK